MVVRIAREDIEQGDRSACPPGEPTRELIGLPDLRGTMAETDAEREATIDIRSPRPGVAHVVLGGEHDLGSANQLQNTLSAVQATCPHLVVDLSPVEFIDSSTIHALLHAKNAATEGGGRFNIVLSTTPLVERVLEITGVLGLLNRVHSLDEALQVS
jgi:anti-anti-sigma factor